MSCAQRGIDSATAAVDLEAAGEGVPGSLVSPTVSARDADRKRGFNRTENAADPSLGPGRPASVEMLGWAVMVNALTMARHRAAEGLEAAA